MVLNKVGCCNPVSRWSHHRKKGRKGGWAREVWFWQLRLLRHPVQSSAAVDSSTVTEGSAGESVQSHVVLS